MKMINVVTTTRAQDNAILWAQSPSTAYEITKAKRAHRNALPLCVVCNRPPKFWGRKSNDVHHIRPVHLYPELACDPSNLITLCRVHHFTLGHFGNWKSWNSEIELLIRIERQNYLSFMSEHQQYERID